MKTAIEFPVAELREQEQTIRISIPAAVAGGAGAALGYMYLARNEMLPDVFTTEVMGDIDRDASGTVEQRIQVGKDGRAQTTNFDLMTSGKEHELKAFTMPMNQDNLAETADQVQKQVTGYLAEHPVKAGSSVKVELEVLDQTFSVDPFVQQQILSMNNGAKILRGQDRVYNRTAFESYIYAPEDSSKVTNPQLLNTGESLQQLVQSKLPNDTVEKASVTGEKAVPFTVQQYERLAQLAQNHGYGDVEGFLSENFYNGTEAHDQINVALHEMGVLTDQPSVIVRVIEQFPEEDAVTIEACQIQTTTVAESYYHKELNPAPAPLEFIIILGAVAAGLRSRRRRRVLDNERLRNLGLDGPAPDDETFEAVKNGTADTRQKLRVLRYQKAAEHVDATGKRFNSRRVRKVGLGLGLAGFVGMLSISAMNGGDKPDKKPVEMPAVQIVEESSEHCSGSDMVTVSYDENAKEERKYLVDTDG